MKKFFLTAIVVIFACIVNAADQQPVKIQHNSTQPWDKNKGTLGRQAGEAVGPTYYYQRGDVIFGATWGEAHNNQMSSYERVDKYGNNISGWKYENGTFEFTSDYVWTDFASRYDGQNGDYGNIVEFGYYNIVDGQDTVTHAVMSVVDGVDLNTNSVIFEKGEKIGFYAVMQDERTNQTVTYTTTQGAIDGADVFINNVDTNSRGLKDQYFCLFKDQIDGQKHYEYYLAGNISIKDDQTYEQFIEEIVDYIEKNGGDPSNITDSNGNSVGGQPLPGLLLSMVIGGTAVAFSKKRKKA